MRIAALAMLIVLAIWGTLRALAEGRRSDRGWLPEELQGARLAYSESTFRSGEPIPMVVRIDRAYEGQGGELVLVEFKRRRVARPRPSDVVQLSVQRYVLQRAGRRVSRRAYVAVLLPGNDTPMAVLPVTLERADAVERRIKRLVAVLEERARPEGAAHLGICETCGHQGVCPDRRCQDS
jgi:hypothetical protein